MPDEEDDSILRVPLDSQTVARLYDRFYEAIFRYCLRRLFDRESAEDAVSSTFLSMAKRIREFRGRTLQSFRAWLYVIAANQVSQSIRQKIHHERMLKELTEQIRQQQQGNRSELGWPALYQAILSLDEGQQHLIALRFFQRLSHAEIAQMVGCREGTIRVRIHRALQQLRPSLQMALDDEHVREMDYGN